MDREDRPKTLTFKGIEYRRHKNYYIAPPSVREEHSNLHRAIWANAHGEIPAGHHIHHINGDPFDNRIENLECIPAAEHLSEHAKNSQWIKSGGAAAQLDKVRHLAVNWHRSDEGRAWHSNHAKELWECREPVAKECNYCRETFKTKHYHQQFCCRLCKQRKLNGVNTAPPPRRCHCGNEFEIKTAGSTKKYCSPKCKWRGVRAAAKSRKVAGL